MGTGRHRYGPVWVFSPITWDKRPGWWHKGAYGCPVSHIFRCQGSVVLYCKNTLSYKNCIYQVNLPRHSISGMIKCKRLSFMLKNRFVISHLMVIFWIDTLNVTTYNYQFENQNTIKFFYINVSLTMKRLIKIMSITNITISINLQWIVMNNMENLILLKHIIL